MVRNRGTGNSEVFVSGPTATQGSPPLCPFGPDSPLAQVSPPPGHTVDWGTGAGYSVSLGEAGTIRGEEVPLCGPVFLPGFQPHSNQHIHFETENRPNVWLKVKNMAGRTPECKWTGATLPTCGGGRGQPEPWVDAALQVVPGRLQEQSRQTAVRVGGALPQMFRYQEATRHPLAMAQVPGN